MEFRKGYCPECGRRIAGPTFKDFYPMCSPCGSAFNKGRQQGIRDAIARLHIPLEAGQHEEEARNTFTGFARGK